MDISVFMLWVVRIASVLSILFGLVMTFKEARYSVGDIWVSLFYGFLATVVSFCLLLVLGIVVAGMVSLMLVIG